MTFFSFSNSYSFSEKEVEMGKLEIKDREKTLIVHEISRIAKEKDQEIMSWEERYAKSTTSHDYEVKRLDSRLAGKQLFTRNQFGFPVL